MKSIFSFRIAYCEYISECLDCEEQPWTFRAWFETVFYYDMVDLMPAGETQNVTFASFKASVN